MRVKMIGTTPRGPGSSLLGKSNRQNRAPHRGSHIMRPPPLSPRSFHSLARIVPQCFCGVDVHSEYTENFSWWMPLTPKHTSRMLSLSQVGGEA